MTDNARPSRFVPGRCPFTGVATEQSDEDLVHRTLAGEQNAFADLVRRYRRAALARALAIFGFITEFRGTPRGF